VKPVRWRKYFSISTGFFSDFSNSSMRFSRNPKIYFRSRLCGGSSLHHFFHLEQIDKGFMWNCSFYIINLFFQPCIQIQIGSDLFIIIAITELLHIPVED